MTIDVILYAFYKDINKLNANFGNFNGKLLCKLFTQHCTNLYGIILCDISSPDFKNIVVCWRKSLRRIFHLPNNTHNSIVNHLNSQIPLELSIYKRIYKFYNNMLNSSNEIVKCVTARLKYSNSNFATNIKLLEYKFDISDMNISKFNDLVKSKHNTSKTNIQWLMNIIFELIDIRDGVSNTQLNRQYILDIIEQLCTR